MKFLNRAKDKKTIRHLQFKQAQSKNLQLKAQTVVEKFQKFREATPQSVIEARFIRRASRQRAQLERIGHI